MSISLTEDFSHILSIWTCIKLNASVDISGCQIGVQISLTPTQVTRWVPDHMASHCFNCDSEFWIAKRRHHCR